MLGLVLGADGLEGATARKRLGTSGEHDDVGALLGGRNGTAQACGAGAYNDDLVRLGLGDLILGDGLGSNHERPGALLKRFARDDVALGCRGNGLGIVGQRGCGAARNGSGGDRAGTCEEALAAHVLLHANRLHFWKIPVRRRPFASPFEWGV